MNTRRVGLLGMSAHKGVMGKYGYSAKPNYTLGNTDKLIIYAIIINDV